MKINELKTAAEALGLLCLENEPMKTHTSFNIGGAADLFIGVSDVSTLPSLLESAKGCSVPVTVIGKGTNLLVSDDGIEGAVLCISDDGLKIEGNGIICSAGVRLTRLCLAARNADLSGVEFACGIPGTVGGAVFMNAGAYGGEMKDVIASCTSVMPNGEIVTRSADELDMGYRTSIYKFNGEVIVSAQLKLKAGDGEQIRAAMEEFLSKRKQKQPLEYPSAGSTFKRPEGHFAGALIEECGLKGFSVGGAQVSEKHAGFVINKGNATCRDVEMLIRHIQDTVLEMKNIYLETEVVRLGR